MYTILIHFGKTKPVRERKNEKEAERETERKTEQRGR